MMIIHRTEHQMRDGQLAHTKKVFFWGGTLMDADGGTEVGLDMDSSLFLDWIVLVGFVSTVNTALRPGECSV